MILIGEGLRVGSLPALRIYKCQECGVPLTEAEYTKEHLSPSAIAAAWLMIRRASSVMTSCIAVGLTLIDPRIFWTPFVNLPAGRTTHRYLEIDRY